MERASLGLTFDCCLRPRYLPILLAMLSLETMSLVYNALQFDPYDTPKRLVYGVAGLYVRFGHTVCGVICTAASLGWLNCHKGTLQKIVTNLDLLKSHLKNEDRPCDSHLKEWCIGFAIMLLITLWGAWFRIKNQHDFFWFLPLALNLSFSYLFSRQFVLLFSFVNNFYTILQQSRKYENSVRCSNILSRIVDDIYQMFRLPILLIISWTFLLTVFNAHFILRVGLSGIMRNFRVLLMTLFYLYPIGSIIRSCNEFNQQVNKFKEHLYWQIIDDQSGELLNSERLDLYFIVADEMGFTVCDFFPVDNALICSMISTATTYLVILLQFDEDNPSQHQLEINTTLASN